MLATAQVGKGIQSAHAWLLLVEGSSMYLAGQMYNVKLEEKLALRCHKANL
jgi:hypothetical protein